MVKTTSIIGIVMVETTSINDNNGANYGENNINYWDSYG
jgi:hypothetical protein